eukprot:1647145-Rhodomonas_salina.2
MLLVCYALATRSPVMTSRILLPGHYGDGSTEGEGELRYRPSRVLREVRYSHCTCGIGLRTCYAKSGTHKAHAGIGLRACYAKACTDIAKSGTDIAYGATRTRCSLPRCPMMLARYEPPTRLRACHAPKSNTKKPYFQYNLFRYCSTPTPNTL